MVIDLVVALLAGEHHLLRIDDDDVVAVVDMGREAGLVLAAQAHRDDGREAANDEALGVDEKPLLLDVGRLVEWVLPNMRWFRVRSGAGLLGPPHRKMSTLDHDIRLEKLGLFFS